MVLPWHLYVMAAIYLLAGLNHFRKPQLYRKIIPPYLPWHAAINYTSGAAEIVIAIGLCIPAISAYTAWGLIALLIAVFPANIYMYTEKNASLRMPKWLLLLRLPLQVVLIIWAYIYTNGLPI
ncbi:MAG: DoxX family protein [Flavobacterium sp. BFFFF1]|uniref:DoxX family protein n=1 Tax=unclassified Flavobacterium TaxID=196869 RepID=UPI000BD33CEC|nr:MULTISPECIES: DoxX family protein [unclassified Flavobacterium]OYU80848.1 MAG: DoxX family protein [Flavobacterium sp. BFFFF1]